MSEESGGWRSIGTHRLRFEPPDLIVLEDRGDFSPADVAALVEEANRLAAARGPLLWLNDIRQLGDVPAATRKRLVQRDLISLVRAAAIFGASFPKRMLFRMVVNALRLTYDAPIPEIQLFASEEEARAWLDEVRRGRSALP
jgi:hypothetical protein